MGDSRVIVYGKDIDQRGFVPIFTKNGILQVDIASVTVAGGVTIQTAPGLPIQSEIIGNGNVAYVTAQNSIKNASQVQCIDTGGNTFQQLRGHSRYNAMPSQAYAIGTYTYSFTENHQFRSALLITRATAVGGGGSLTITIKGIDNLLTANWTILTGAAIAAPSTQILRVDCALTAGANIAADMMPVDFDIDFVVAGNSVTFGSQLILID